MRHDLRSEIFKVQVGISHLDFEWIHLKGGIPKTDSK